MQASTGSLMTSYSTAHYKYIVSTHQQLKVSRILAVNFIISQQCDQVRQKMSTARHIHVEPYVNGMHLDLEGFQALAAVAGMGFIEIPISIP